MPHSTDEDRSDAPDTDTDGPEKPAAPKKKKKKLRTGRGMYEFVKAQTSQRYANDYFDYKFTDIVKVINQVKELFMKEKMLIECAAPFVVVGDLHGQYNDLLRVFNKFNDPANPGKGPGWLKERYICMGDYVDRGKQSLEVLMVLFCLKIMFPKSFCLLRGNHETKAINKAYGFLQELSERFDKDDARELFIKFNELFTHMPIACLAGGSVLCMHGGISPLLQTLDDIRNIPKPLADPNSNQLACDLMWSDPMIDLHGHRPNEVRGVSIHFGEDLLLEVMKRLGLTLVVRGHQMMMNGFNFFSNKQLVTVFTAASYYPDRPNHGAVLFMNKDGRIGFKILTPMDDEVGEKVFRGEHDIANEYDTGYLRCDSDYKKKKSKKHKSPARPANKKSGLELKRVE